MSHKSKYYSMSEQMHPDNFICIIADMIGSRQSSKSKLLPEIVETLNKQADADWIIPFKLRAGDELFAVFTTISAGFRAFFKFHQIAKTYKVRFYVGVGVGKLEPENRTDQHRINGPAIWRASDALKELKQNPSSEVLKSISKLDFRYNLHGSDNKDLNSALEIYLHCIMQHVEARTPQQNLAIQLLEEHPDWSNAQLYWAVSGTDDNKVSSSYATANFSKLLARADYRFVCEAVEKLTILLQSLIDSEL